MASLDHGLGAYILDNRNSPGLTAKDVAHMPAGKRPTVVGEGQIFEADAAICSHCQDGVLLNPGRVRARAVCKRCYKYICDPCAAEQHLLGGQCVPFVQILDRAQALAERHVGQPDHPDLLVLNTPQALAYAPAPRVIVPG